MSGFTVSNFEFLCNGMTFLITSTCYPASQLEDFGGPLCCEFNGWKEMKKYHYEKQPNTRHHGIYLQQMLVNAPLAVKQNNANV